MFTSGVLGRWFVQKNMLTDTVRVCRSPLMSYDSITSDVNRLAKCKNFTMFQKDLANNKLPQWMFITPNMSK